MKETDMAGFLYGRHGTKIRWTRVKLPVQSNWCKNAKDRADNEKS